jgi:hypothetical protein
MIKRGLADIVISKIALEEIDDGLRRVRKILSGGEVQEDEYLIAIALKNATEVRDCMEALLQVGLPFDNKSGTSQSFTVLAKEGAWWRVPWLIEGMEGAWFIADVEAPAT